MPNVGIETVSSEPLLQVLPLRALDKHPRRMCIAQIFVSLLRGKEVSQ